MQRGWREIRLWKKQKAQSFGIITRIQPRCGRGWEEISRFCTDQSFAETKAKTETKRLNFGLSRVLRLTNYRQASSLTWSASRRWFRRISLFIFEWAKSEVIFAHQNVISNWLTYLVHAKSTGELISFGFSDRSVRSLVSAKRSANRWVQTKKTTSLFGLSLVSVPM